MEAVKRAAEEEGSGTSSDDSDELRRKHDQEMKMKKLQRGIAKARNAMEMAAAGVLDRDNLKIKTLAKYKAIRSGDIVLYQEIEN